MSQSMPPVLIELKGPNPPPGYYWCTTCVILYLGQVSTESKIQEAAQERVQDAIAAGLTEVEFTLPHSWRKLRQAVTIGPSVYDPQFISAGIIAFPQPMPVCWLHLQGAKPGETIIKGKEN